MNHPNTYFQDLKSTVATTDINGSALPTLNNCYDRALLFMGHRIRVFNQQAAIQQIFDGMKTKCEIEGNCHEAVVVIDYKMKMQAKYFRETQTLHFGKRGISWHGAMLQFFSLEKEVDSTTAHLNKFYFDHIPEDENKQDKASVFSLVEAIVIAILAKFPEIKQLTFVSDNATCYQNTMILLVLPIISLSYGITITR